MDGARSTDTMGPPSPAMSTHSMSSIASRASAPLLHQASNEARAAIAMDTGNNYREALVLYRRSVATLRQAQADLEVGSRSYEAVASRLVGYSARIGVLERHTDGQHRAGTENSEGGSSSQAAGSEADTDGARPQPRTLGDAAVGAYGGLGSSGSAGFRSRRGGASSPRPPPRSGSSKAQLGGATARGSSDRPSSSASAAPGSVGAGGAGAKRRPWAAKGAAKRGRLAMWLAWAVLVLVLASAGLVLRALLAVVPPPLVGLRYQTHGFAGGFREVWDVTWESNGEAATGAGVASKDTAVATARASSGDSGGGGSYGGGGGDSSGGGGGGGGGGGVSGGGGGSGGGDVVVLVPGVDGSLQRFAELVPALTAAGLRVVVLSLPTARSALTSVEATADVLLRAVAEAVAAATGGGSCHGPVPVHVVGVGYGAALAQAMALGPATAVPATAVRVASVALLGRASCRARDVGLHTASLRRLLWPPLVSTLAFARRWLLPDAVARAALAASGALDDDADDAARSGGGDDSDGGAGSFRRSFARARSATAHFPSAVARLEALAAFDACARLGSLHDMRALVLYGGGQGGEAGNGALELFASLNGYSTSGYSTSGYSARARLVGVAGRAPLLDSPAAAAAAIVEHIKGAE